MKLTCPKCDKPLKHPPSAPNDTHEIYRCDDCKLDVRVFGKGEERPLTAEQLLGWPIYTDGGFSCHCGRRMVRILYDDAKGEQKWMCNCGTTVLLTVKKHPGEDCRRLRALWLMEESDG